MEKLKKNKTKKKKKMRKNKKNTKNKKNYPITGAFSPQPSWILCK